MADPPVAIRLPLAVPPPPPTRTALQDWDGGAYGVEYLHLLKGETLLGTYPMVLDQGWALAFQPRTGQEGWFPPAFAT